MHGKISRQLGLVRGIWQRLRLATLGTAMNVKKERQGAAADAVEAAAPDVDIGKQALDIAKAADTTVDIVKKAAGLIDGVFGNAVSNTMGLLSDRLAYFRLEKAVMLAEKVDANLKKKGVKRRYVPVAFGLPIIEKASVEDDETLQEKWANLLTNSVDATYDKPLRRNYASILGDMEAVDARILDLLVKEHLATAAEKRDGTLFVKELMVKEMKLDERVCENALRNLMRLGVIKPGVVTGGVLVGDHALSAYKDTEMVGITPLGEDFYHAVNLE